MSNIVNQKLNKYADIIQSEEYYKAQKLIKDTDKLMDYVKEYCQDEEKTVLKTDKYLLKFTLKKRDVFSSKNVPKDIYDLYKSEGVTWTKTILSLEDLE